MESYKILKTEINKLIDKHTKLYKEYRLSNGLSIYLKENKLHSMKKEFTNDILQILRTVTGKDCSNFLIEAQNDYVKTWVNNLKTAVEQAPETMYRVVTLPNFKMPEFNADKAIIDEIVKVVKDSNDYKIRKTDFDELISNFIEFTEDSLKSYTIFEFFNEKTKNDELYEALNKEERTFQAEHANAFNFLSKLTIEEENKWYEIQMQMISTKAKVLEAQELSNKYRQEIIEIDNKRNEKSNEKEKK